MSVREELDLPPAAGFALGNEGGVHITNIFGGTWCEDFCDEETGEYAPDPGETYSDTEPSAVSSLCEWCVKSSKAE